ncbi:rhodanese-related sulfurtransferase [Candidatus Pelagibacter sp.]|nr:rhodanese-related sulfurtransferase [Candidatus Pelagibacter sp.]
MFDVFGFYKFKNITNIKKKKKILKTLFSSHKVRGTIIISKEGINGTISGKNKDLLNVKKNLKKILLFRKFNSENYSKSKFNPFHRAKVKIKKEVVPMGFKISSFKKTKLHISPKKWNNLIKKRNTKLIDVRKPFEYGVGSFKNSINPKVENFRDFPKYLNKFNKNDNIAMFCTGGIRCEKASIYLRKKGFKNIYQLKGGIINYLKTVDKKSSLWRGECYVFDNRISLKHELKQGTYSMCSGCRKPVSRNEKKSEKYAEGISCPKCHDYLTKDQKSRFAMRQKQILIAKKTGKRHIFQKEY